MSKINVKESILSVVKKSNLEILKIDLMNDEESFVRSYGKERNEFCKVYNSLDDLDFEVESFVMSDEVLGTVYCQDKDTKEPVWLLSRGDECYSWWEVNRVPDFYKNNPRSYRVKSEFKYRPFKDIEECLVEMQKHHPFGWIKNCGDWYNIISTDVASVKIINTRGAIVTLHFRHLLANYHFADGTLFGVKEEE